MGEKNRFFRQPQAAWLSAEKSAGSENRSFFLCAFALSISNR